MRRKTHLMFTLCILTLSQAACSEDGQRTFDQGAGTGNEPSSFGTGGVDSTAGGTANSRRDAGPDSSAAGQHTQSTGGRAGERNAQSHDGGDSTAAGGQDTQSTGGRPSDGGAPQGDGDGGAATTATGGQDATGGEDAGTGGSAGGPVVLPAPTCQSDGGSSEVRAPELVASLGDRWHEAWLGSPTVADLDEDGVQEILAPRDELMLGWHIDGTVVFRAETAEGRIWASPIVADLVPSSPGLEVAAASRSQVYAWDAQGQILAGFPTTWQNELRSLAAGDIDADGSLELVAVTTSKLTVNELMDIVIAYEMDGSVVDGFPPNTSGTSGCDDRCYTQGGFDQNLALADLDGDGAADIFVPQDNAYVTLHHGNGVAFDSNAMFQAPKVNGIRFLHDLAEVQQGYPDNEETALQAHFTNSPPAITDLDGDGELDLIMLGSVQNGLQTDRLKGVALWAIHSDGTRLEDWVEPLHFPDYLGGLVDFEGTNYVAATNQVSVADLDADSPGPELVFAGFDGTIHAVNARREELWAFQYTADERVLTSGLAVADLSKDGVPELVFNTYSPDVDKSHLFVLDAAGKQLHKIVLPAHGATPVPTVADVDDDGTVEIVVSLKECEDRAPQVLVYTVPGSGTHCLPWPTGRANLLRDGFVPAGND